MHTFCMKVWLVTKEICWANVSGKQLYLLSSSMKLGPWWFGGLCPPDQRETQARYPFFQNVVTFVKSHPCSYLIFLLPRDSQQLICARSIHALMAACANRPAAYDLHVRVLRVSLEPFATTSMSVSSTIRAWTVPCAETPPCPMCVRVWGSSLELTANLVSQCNFSLSTVQPSCGDNTPGVLLMEHCRQCDLWHMTLFCWKTTSVSNEQHVMHIKEPMNTYHGRLGVYPGVSGSHSI